MDELFNNREIAVGIWLLAFLVFAYVKVGREPFVDVLKHALTPKILTPLFLSFVPTVLVVGVLAYYDLWDLSVLKETIYWVIGTGLVMFGRFTEVKSAKELYRRTAKDTLKVIIILEFLIWFYVFPLWAELLLVPFTTLIVMLATVAKYQKTDGIELTRKVLSGIQVAIGLAILLFVFIALIKNPQPLFTYQNLELFLLPIVLSFTYIPSVYLVALYSNYELVFNRINYFTMMAKKDKKAIKLAAIRRCGLSLYTANRMIRYLAFNLNNKTTKAQAVKLIRAFDPEKEYYIIE